MRLALLFASVVLAAQPAAASPFGPNRSEGAPPTKKKPKPAKKRARVVEDAKVARHVADDGEVVDDEEDEEKDEEEDEEEDEEDENNEEDEPVATKPAIDDAPTAKPGKRRTTLAAKPGKKPAITKLAAAELAIDDEIPAISRPSSDDDAKPKTTARLDDESDIIDEAEPSVTKVAAPGPRHETRFYFRIGLIKQSSKLGATEFSLQTDLPIDTSSLGRGDSGVEMQQSNFPVAMIVGYVLPVLGHKLSLETIIGIPTKSEFKATGSLAHESLAPTFMGMPTGIEPLGEDIGEATFAPPMLTAVYRIAELGPITPFAGTGIMLLMARGAKITNPVLNEAGDPKLSFSPSPGLVLQGGAELRLWKRVSARLDVKYVLGMTANATIEDIAVTPKAIPALGSIEVGDAVMSAKITPLVVQLGVGADF